MAANDNGGVSAVAITRKRKADVLGRLEHSSATQGRGALAGWTKCPLCSNHSNKKYALGRGIAMHLHAVHTPWNPGKRKKQKLKRQESIQTELLEPWVPTDKEKEEWDARVLQIATELEQAASSNPTTAGVDRNGKSAVPYRKSLPPFIQAAADGDLKALQQFVKQAGDDIQPLLDTRDRNGSTAHHWAAGEGHLECLKYLLQWPSTSNTSKKLRRRDGKTCLHYAARNGRIECMRHLLETQQQIKMDEPSGDGTTPLHMACFGGHLDALELLLQHGANIHQQNEWGCTAAHWVAMMKTSNADEQRVFDLCHKLLKLNVSFTTRQKQGHAPLHKAAQRGNRHFIQWLHRHLSEEEHLQLGQPDHGGHLASDIWRSCGGDESFAQWISERGW